MSVVRDFTVYQSYRVANVLLSILYTVHKNDDKSPSGKSGNF